MNHTIRAKNATLTATISAMRRYIFVDSAQNFVWQSRQRYGERKSGWSESPASREDRRTLWLLQFGHCRGMSSIVRNGSRDYRANRMSGANRRYTDAGRQVAGGCQARNGGAAVNVKRAAPGGL